MYLEDIVQAACLAHDIGIPPFGHTGEQAIASWFTENAIGFAFLTTRQHQELSQFEGNAQGFRLLTACVFDEVSTLAPLTYATLATYLKYPWCVGGIGKSGHAEFGCFDHKKSLLLEVAQHTGLPSKAEHVLCRHPLTYLVEDADDLCYGLLDLEDGLALHLISWQDMIAVFEPIFDTTQDEYLLQQLNHEQTSKEFPLLRGPLMAYCIQSVVAGFIEHEKALLSGNFAGQLIDYSSAVNRVIDNAKHLARTAISNYPVKQTQELAASDLIHRLLDKFFPAIRACFHQQASLQQHMLIQLKEITL